MDLHLSNDPDQPLYRQIAEAVRRAIEEGALRAGQRLPAGARLADQFGVNALTVHRGYALLAAEGLVEQRHGSGTYVRSPINRSAPTAPHAKGSTLRSIVMVVGGPHLARCHRDARRLVTEMIEGLDDVLGERPVRITFTESLDRACLGRLEPGAAVLLKQARKIEPGMVDELAQRGIPVLGVLNNPGNFSAPRLGFDVHQATRLACEHLLDCGYRRLGYIGNMGGSTILGAKFLEFTNVLYRAGLDFQVRHVRDAPNNLGRSYEAASSIIEGGDLPDALLVETDYRAMEVIAALQRAGWRVPEDIGVASMDDVPEAAWFDPPLTTVRTPQYEIGQAAARMLMDWYHHGRPLQSKVIDAELIVRQTTLADRDPADVHASATT